MTKQERKEELIDFLDGVLGWFPQCEKEIEEIKQIVRKSK